MKFDNYGNLVWVKAFGGTGSDTGNGICADNTGHVYLTGRYVSNIQFGNLQLSDTCNSQMYIVKMDSMGTPITAKGGTCIGGNSISEGFKLACDFQGDIYVSGQHTYFNLDTFQVGGGGGPYDAFFLAKLNSSLNVLWAEQIMDGFISELRDMAVDSLSQPIITGRNFWTTGGYARTEKFGSNGNLLWDHGVSGLCGYGRSGDSFGVTNYGSSCFVVGRTYPGYSTSPCGQSVNFYLRKYANDGTTLFYDTINADINESDIISVGNGEYITCGWNNPGLALGTNTVTSNNFIAKFKEVNMATVVKESQSDNLKIYPNPAAGVLYLNFAESGQSIIKLYDLLGNIRYHQATEKSITQIDISNIPTGVYFVEVSSKSGTERKQIVIAK